MDAQGILTLSWLCSLYVLLMSESTSAQDEYSHSQEPEAFIPAPSSGESRLVGMLLQHYSSLSPYTRPVLNSTQPITIYFALALQKILDIDEKHQVLTTHQWLQHEWMDEFLTWDPNDFDGVTKVRLRATQIWTPDIILYNDLAVGKSIRNDDANAFITVYHDGKVVWIPRSITQSSCEVNPMEFPFDEQTCVLKFGSWTHSTSQLDLRFLRGEERARTSNFMPSSEWELVKNNATRNDVKYTCCEDTFCDLSYELVLRRRPAFFARFMLLPVIFLSTMVMMIFWIPPQRPDRTGLGMSLFTSFMLLLLLVVDTTPPTNSKLGVFCCYQIIGVTIATFLSILVVNVSYQKRPMPVSISRFVHRIPGVCSGSPQTNSRLNGHSPSGKESTSSDKDSSKPLFDGFDKCANSSRVSSPHMDPSVDWVTLAIVLDRVFFICYMLYFIAVFINIFPFPSHPSHYVWI